MPKAARYGALATCSINCRFKFLGQQWGHRVLLTFSFSRLLREDWSACPWVGFIPWFGLHSYFDTLLYEYEAQNEQLHAADLNQQLVLSARWTNCKNAGSVSWNKNYSQTVSYELFSTTFQFQHKRTGCRICLFNTFHFFDLTAHLFLTHARSFP